MSKEAEEMLDKIAFAAMQLENRIDDLAMHACKRGAPHNVHWIMIEHNKIHRMVRRLNRVALGAD